MSESVRTTCLVFDHDEGRLVRAWRSSGDRGLQPWSLDSVGADLRTVLLEAARLEPSAWIGWRRVSNGEQVGPPRWELPTHERICLHAGLTDPERAAVAHLGYVEQMESIWTPNPSRRCDWLVSAAAGLVHASVLEQMGLWRRAPTLDVAWMDFGRRASRNGVLCLVEDSLVSSEPRLETTRLGSVAGLIKRCHGTKWLLFWAACRSLYGPGRLRAWLEVLAVLGVAGAARPSTSHRTKAPARPASAKEFGSVSVVVPTLGRPRSVETLLRDLAAQTVAVYEVVVVAQGGDGGVGSAPATRDLAVQSIEVEWAGTCRARNLAMSRTSGDWILLLDDDVRCPSDFLETFATEIASWGLDAASARVSTPRGPLSDEEKFGEAFPSSRGTSEEPPRPDWMWPGFAGGASMVRAGLARRIDGFDERLDRGYGEDFDFGVRLRDVGARFLQLQRPFVVHYHEPSGGFRAPAEQPWHAIEEPKPSPYILQSRSGLHRTCRRGYAVLYLSKTILPFPWPWRVAGVLRRWRSSRRWAARLEREKFGGIRSWSAKSALPDRPPTAGERDVR